MNKHTFAAVRSNKKTAANASPGICCFSSSVFNGTKTTNTAFQVFKAVSRGSSGQLYERINCFFFVRCFLSVKSALVNDNNYDEKLSKSELWYARY